MNAPTPATVKFDDPLHTRFSEIRALSRRLIEGLSAEDACVQSMPDCSPAKWHLAHTTWFFETFVLAELSGYKEFHSQFKVLFNSYYNSVGEQHPRPRRGLLTRPDLQTVLDYREHVDLAMDTLLTTGVGDEIRRIIDVGLHHEQQHQELLLMDIKHLFSCNPLRPAYREPTNIAAASPKPAAWHAFDGGITEIGADGDAFCFDNELPRHPVLLTNYQLADRLVTNREYLDFIEDGGYETPTLWLADGWATIQEQRWQRPLYWQTQGDQWFEFTLRGLESLDPAVPVSHVSYYEADAYARWAGARLPTEAEWENASRSVSQNGRFLDLQRLHPTAAGATTDSGLMQMFGDLWEWTASAYLPYPGYQTPPGAIGEYNGKFMSNQMVLKGGCCATPIGHTRASYRNFFYPHCRWQFSGIRLAC